jgi:hypothetical protein
MSILFSFLAALSVVGSPLTGENTLDISVEGDMMTVVATMESSREPASAIPDWVPVNIVQNLESETSTPISFSDSDWRNLADRISEIGVEVAAWGVVDSDFVATTITEGMTVEQLAILPRLESWGSDLTAVAALDSQINVYDEAYDDYFRVSDPDCITARDFAVARAPFADRADVTVVAEPDRCVIVMTHHLPVSTDIERDSAEQFIEVFTGGAVMMSGSPDAELVIDVRPASAEVLSPAGDIAPGGTQGFLDAATITDADGVIVEAFTRPEDPSEPAVFSGPVTASRPEVPAATSLTTSTVGSPDPADRDEEIVTASSVSSSGLPWMALLGVGATISIFAAAAFLLRRRQRFDIVVGDETGEEQAADKS